MNTALPAFRLLPLLLSALCMIITQRVNAQYVTNGSASSSGGDCYELTPDQGGQAGSIFSSAPIDLSQPFSLIGTMNFGGKDANGADGIVFIFTTTNTALGIGGGGIGHQGIMPSFAVEIDDYLNGNFGDPASDHIAIMRNGSVDHNSGDNLAGPFALPNIEDGADHCFSVSWNPGSQSFSASLDGNVITYNGDIAGIIGSSSVYYGFSSGTGSLSNPHRVCFGAPQVEPMDDVTICPGESVQLQADPAGNTWTWTPDPTLSAWDISDPVATPTVTTTYFVTIGYNCGGIGVDDVTVFVQPEPPAMASNNGPLCAGETLELSAGGGVGYEWTGPVFSSSQQNPTIPNVELFNAGTYTVTVTDAFGCTGTASTEVVIFPNPVVAIVPYPLPLCEDADPLQMEAVPAGGIWGGAAAPNGVVDPAVVGVGIHDIFYTYIDQNGCLGEDQTTVEVVPLPIVEIFSAGPLCDTDPVYQMEASPSGGFWGGVANVQGEVDPAQTGPGNHLITYTYTDANGCTVTEFFTLLVLAGTTVEIDPAGPFCPDEPIQVLSGTPAGGTWGGVANSAGEIDPSALGPGMHLVTYAVTAQGSCPGADSIQVEVFESPLAIINGSGTICAGSGETVPLSVSAGGAAPIEVTLAIDGIAQPPINVSAGTTNIPAGEPGVYTIVNVVDANGCTGQGSGSALVIVVGAPQVSNFDIECDPTQTNYTVSFEVSGGDPATYEVDGNIPGTLSPDPPYVFISDPIPSGTGYTFFITDANQCDTVNLSGNFSCQCITDAGTMDLTPITVCENDLITAIHNGDETLDANDFLFFVLHNGNGNSLGTIFGSAGSPVFNLVPPMQPGVTYYISAVAGDSDGMGGVDLNDPCLSVSFGTPVQWRALPEGSISGDASICQGEQATLVFSLSGNAPFDVSYSDGTQTFDLNNIFDGHAITVNPNTTTTYELELVGDNSNPACTQLVSSTVTITVNDPVEDLQNASICEGESILLGGQLQTQSGVYYDSLTTFRGCDSVVITTLAVNPVDTSFITDSDCNPANTGTFTTTYENSFGCDSVVVLTVVFSDTDTSYVNSPTCDPAQAGTFTNTYVTPQGCDSVVIETVFLLPSDTVFTTDNTCDPASTGMFSGSYTNQWGCDSTVITTVTLLPSDTTELTDTSCDPNSVGVFTNVLTNQNGCDSTVILTVTFADSDTTLVTSNTCELISAGVFTNTYTAADGCDSVVIETVVLQPGDTVFLESETCDPQQAGTFTNVFTNQFGCDSMVTETIVLNPSDNLTISLTSCEPADTGTVVLNLFNQFGCDSIVTITTSLLPPDECDLEFTLTGDTIPCGATLGSLFVEITQGLLPVSFAWENNLGATGSGTSSDAVFQIPDLSAGLYSVTVTAGNGLTTELQAILLQVTPPDVQAGVISDYNGYGVSCHGATDGSAMAMVSGDFGPYQLSWSNGETGFEISDLGSGTYDVVVTGDFGCTGMASVTITEPPPLQMTFTINHIDCFGQNEGAVIAEVTGGTPPYQYSMNGSPLQSSNAFTGLTEGAYQVTAIDANGCETTEALLINAPVPVVVDLGEDQEIQLGDSYTIQAVVNVPEELLEDVNWTGIDTSECPDCLDQVVAPLITTTYSIVVTAENGCTGSDDLTIFVDRRKDVYIPNAFSPNGDGINDEFQIFAKAGIIKNIKSFLIFSRWGETVFQYYDFIPGDPEHRWDGTHRGEELDPAVFVWFAEIEFIDGQVVLYEGDVTLVK